MNTYNYEDSLFRIDPNLRSLRDLKELYVQFNSKYKGDPINAKSALFELINIYSVSRHKIFRDFATLLVKYQDPIINSFTMTERVGNGGIYDSRLSNGPIESLNRKVKDLKRMGRGFRNFDHFRNRFLFASRSAPILNGINPLNSIHYPDEFDF